MSAARRVRAPSSRDDHPSDAPTTIPSASTTSANGIAYTTGAGSTVIIPNKINPFDILGVKRESDRSVGKERFRSLICTPHRQQRAMVSLAYSIYCRIKYRDTGDTTSLERAEMAFDEATGMVSYNPLNLWTLAVAGDVEAMAQAVQADKSVLTRDNDCQETLLYIVSRSGFVDVVGRLLSMGAPVNHQQKTGSTALHAAAYFGHLPVVTRLLAAGADPALRNRMPSNRPIDETPKSAVEVAEALTNAAKRIDPLTEFIQQAQAEGLVGTVQNIVVDGETVAVRVNHKQRSAIPQEGWSHAWHGTKKENLISIFKTGLRKPGTKLPSGDSVTIPPGHIKEGATVAGIAKWSSAVFVSPSLTYSAHPAYAKRFARCGAEAGEWCSILHVMARQGSFTAHPSTVVTAHKKLLGEPADPEFRVDEPAAHVTEFDAAVTRKRTLSNEDKEGAPDDDLMRVTDDKNLLVAGVVFCNIGFLERTGMTYEALQQAFIGQ